MTVAILIFAPLRECYHCPNEDNFQSAVDNDGRRVCPETNPKSTTTFTEPI